MNLYTRNAKVRRPDIPTLFCFFDGSIAPSNPGGVMGWGVYIENEKGEEILSDCGGERAAPDNTNNIAEYKALNLLFDFLLTQPPSEIFIKGDSMLVIKQMIGRWRILGGAYADTARVCKEKLVQLKEIHKFKDVLHNPSIKWIPREENLYADELSNQGREKFLL